ncbi:hypothetical protein SAMN05421504_106345 [Amycolatopsis xylanica]|uniref:Uncharacterized protein n=1 Tax=Amycolatopsis xylanica TaxID=589385 RepID=A0A1H3LUB7_9PSEU|nr:hypothetical protein SAMN05421504_106345 [Amycolatopsis xylanica]
MAEEEDYNQQLLEWLDIDLATLIPAQRVPQENLRG